MVFVFLIVFSGIILVLGYMYNKIIVVYGYINLSLLEVILSIIVGGVFIFVIDLVVDLFSFGNFVIVSVVAVIVVLFVVIFGIVLINICERLVKEKLIFWGSEISLKLKEIFWEEFKKLLCI